jgi:hypothetical protein
VPKTIINVNKHVIAKNLRHGTNEPPIMFRRGASGKATYAHAVEILGPARIIHSPDKPLKCGARVWIETEGDVRAL